MRDPRDVILKPVVSEKSYALLDENVYTFVVAPEANKIEIKAAVEAIFHVKVAPPRFELPILRMIPARTACARLPVSPSSTDSRAR
jgi:hypothetical protein